jgi:uncharacterized protein (UPF0332 family)
MMAEDKRKELVLYRMKQAYEAIDEAEYLLLGSKSARSVINRAYYGMFYAVLALLIFEPYASSKHTGVLAYFNKRFIKEGIFPESLGRSINKAFELRQRADYREFAELTREQVEPLISEARQFVGKIEEYLGSRAIIEGGTKESV